MEREQKIAGLKFLAQIHRQQLDERRKYEWKVVFTSLTFCVLTAAAMLEGDVQLQLWSKWLPVLLIIAIFAVLCATIKFMASVNKANNKSKIFAEWAENYMASLVEGTSPPQDSPFPLDEQLDTKYWISGCPLRKNGAWACKNGTWAWWWQVAVLVAFATVACGLIILELMKNC